MLRTWNRRVKLLMLLPIFLNSLNIFFIYLIPQMILQFCYLRLYAWHRNCFLLSVNRWKCFCTSAVNHKKKFPHFLSYLLIAYLITVSLEKEITVLEKVSKKSWILDPRIGTNSVIIYYGYCSLKKSVCHLLHNSRGAFCIWVKT